MTLMKSILLGSAAGIVAVASAQAADLPTKKAAPAEYVKICNVGGMAGFVIPGSDTCLKIGGYVTAQIEAGNLATGYLWASPATQGKALLSTPSGAVGRTSLGYTTRFNLDLDAREMTSYGVLRSYVSVNIEASNGFDGTGTAAYIDQAYLQWAGITAGKAVSFFSFYGGGEGWANLISPDQQGYNEPLLFAYTGTFGGGFSATIAAQSSGPNSPDGGAGSNYNISNYAAGGPATTNYGESAPDVVANIRIDQAWGAAQLSGVAHQVHVLSVFGPSENIWGWGANFGAKFNLPTLGPGDNIAAQTTWTKNAYWYGGLPDAMWGEDGATNGNGLALSGGDAYFAPANKFGPGTWAAPTVWSASALFEHHFSPQFSFDPEVAYANLTWSNTNGQLGSSAQSWLVGAVAHWDPLPLLDFALEVLYQNTHQSTPGLYTTAPVGTINGVAAAFPNNTSGVAGRFYITRNF
ncbi:MAG: porin [Roseiarcus sp.]